MFLHQVHRVRGAREEEFEAAYREGWMDWLARSDAGRLLWYFNQAHGSGPSYRVVTITAFRDAAAWEAVAREVQAGELCAWAREIDGLQHTSTGKLLAPLPWSPLGEVDFAGVPVDPGATHALSLYMEDTGWPHVPLDEYTGFWERVYLPMINAPGRDRPRLLEIEAAFQPAWGAGRRPEAILLQKVLDHAGLLRLLETETPPDLRAPGTFMHEALRYRDDWESRLLRTSAWSPLF
ncbi:MAG: hypothetical protein C4344_04155 [Acidimicrobiia bacterium]